MTQELLVALCLCALAPIHAMLSATATANYAGFSWGLGNRSTDPEVPQWVVRFQRSHANLMENLPSFFGVIVTAHLLGIHTELTVFSAWFFLAARITFTVIYTAGITFLYLRTILWFSSVGALLSIIWEIISKSNYHLASIL